MQFIPFKETTQIINGETYVLMQQTHQILHPVGEAQAGAWHDTSTGCRFCRYPVASICPH